MITLYNSTDVAIRLIDGRSDIERNLASYRLTDDGVYSSSKGVVELLGSDVRLYTDVKIMVGDVVYFDPRNVCELKELGLIVMDYKNLLIKETGESITEGISNG